MKKLIMLSIFALGTITASASNDFFKNYYTDNAKNLEIVQGRFRVYVTTTVNTGGVISTVVLEDYITTNCLDFLEADALRVSKLNSYLPQFVYVSVTKVSNC